MWKIKIDSRVQRKYRDKFTIVALCSEKRTVEWENCAESAACCGVHYCTGNENVPKIIINDTINLFLTAFSILLI